MHNPPHRPAVATDIGIINKSKPTTLIPMSSWWLLAVLFILYVSAMVDRLMLTMLVGPIKHDLMLSDLQMSIILGPAFAIFYALFGLPLGWAADRYPRRWVICLGSIFWSLMAMCSGIAHSFWQLFLARVGVGIGEASLTPAAYSLIGDEFPRRRMTLAMAIYQTAPQVGTALAFGIGGVVIGLAGQWTKLPLVFGLELAPWQLALIFTGAPGLILSMLVFTFTEPPRGGDTHPDGASSRQSVFRFLLDRRRLMVPMLVGFTMIILLVNSMMAWVPAYISREWGLPPERYGPMLAGITLVGGVAMLVKGWLVDLLYSRGMKDAHLRFFSWLVGAAIPVGIFTFVVPSPTVFFISYSILAVLIVQFVVYAAATLRMISPPHLQAQNVAFFLAVFAVVGFSLGPPSVAFITDFFFADEAMLGKSLAIVAGTSLTTAFLCLRFALREMRFYQTDGSATFSGGKRMLDKGVTTAGESLRKSLSDTGNS